MFVPVYDLDGELIASIFAGTTLLSVDTTAYDLLVSKLVGGNWTYATIRQGSIVEVIKITSAVSGVLNVLRGRDGTTAQPFSSGASLHYTFTQEAVEDIQAEGPSLSDISLIGEGAVTVQQLSPGTFSISIPTTPLESAEGSRITVTGQWPNQFVTLTGGAYGCCP